jgi:hypothetical protein
MANKRLTAKILYLLLKSFKKNLKMLQRICAGLVAHLKMIGMI